MKNITQLKKELKAAIIDNKIDVVFYILESDITDNQVIENQLISIKAESNRLKNAFIQGTIERKELELQKNQINNRLLELINIIEEKDIQKAEFLEIEKLKKENQTLIAKILVKEQEINKKDEEIGKLKSKIILESEKKVVPEKITGFPAQLLDISKWYADLDSSWQKELKESVSCISSSPTEREIKLMLNITTLTFETHFSLFRDNPFEPLYFLTELRELHIYDQNFNDLKYLKNLHNLVHLDIVKTSVASFKGLENLKNLRSVCYDNQKISQYQAEDIRKENPKIDFYTPVDFYP